jgi:hypothetical protein
LAAAPELKSRRLVRLSVNGLSITRPLHHLWSRSRRQSKAATALMCLVRHHAAARLR